MVCKHEKRKTNLCTSCLLVEIDELRLQLQESKAAFSYLSDLYDDCRKELAAERMKYASHTIGLA